MARGLLALVAAASCGLAVLAREGRVPPGFVAPLAPRGLHLSQPVCAKRSGHDVVTMLSPGKPNIGKGGAVLQKPQLKTRTSTAPPKRKEKTEIQYETKEEESEKFAVMLIGDKEYDQGHVVKVLCKVIPGLGAMKAVAAFQEAQLKGKAIVLICDEESAETVAELICRNKPPVIADVEPLRKGD